MFELTKSTLSYSWAMSLLGLQETYRLFSSGQIPSPPREGGLTSAGLSPEDQLRDLFKAAYEAGDHVQRELIDGMTRYMSLTALYNPGTALQLGTEFLWDMADSFRFFWPDPKTFTAWREIFNKYDVYQLVRSVEKKLKLPREGEFELGEYVEKAYALGPYAALWAVEGLGHDYADSVRERGGELKDLLRGKRLKGLPEKSLLMLHAGIGLSFAQRLFEPIKPKSSELEVRAAIDEFDRLCRENSAEGYPGAAMESLGLVTRTFHSELMPVVDRHLEEKDSALLGYFWHGAGRAIYFLLVNFLPYRDPLWRAVEMGRAEAPHETGRLNALAGTAWALTLVNMRQPQVMAAFLEDHGDDLLESRDAFINGVASSAIMRYDTSPDDPHLGTFRDYEPKNTNRRASDLWEKLVRSPVETALQDQYPVLRQKKRLDEVFRYQPLDTLVASLKTPAPKAK